MKPDTQSHTFDIVMWYYVEFKKCVKQNDNMHIITAIPMKTVVENFIQREFEDFTLYKLNESASIEPINILFSAHIVR